MINNNPTSIVYPVIDSVYANNHMDSFTSVDRYTSEVITFIRTTQRPANGVIPSVNLSDSDVDNIIYIRIQNDYYKREINNGRFNVKWWGAGGIDGDDSTAIQSAVTACQAQGGGIVYFPLGVYKITSQITITGAIYPDTFDNGGVTLKGASMRGSMIHVSGGITGLLFGSGTKMACHIEDLSIYGDGKTTASSRGIYWQNPGGSYTWENLYIHDLETGIEWYDSTLGTMINVNVRLCSKGIKTGYNHDIFNAMGCRFDYCDDALYLGATSVAHATRNQEENCHNYIGCRISNNVNRGVFLNDYGSSGIKFDGCYFETNGKDGEIGVNGAGDTVGPVGVSFDSCYFTPVSNAPVTEGISVYNPASLSFKNCKTVGPTAYVTFVKFYDEAARYIWENNQIEASTAAINHQGFNYNPIRENFYGTSQSVYRRDALTPNMTGAYFNKQLTGGTGKIWESWTRHNGSTNAVLGEVRVQDIGGVLQIGGSADSNGYIVATSVSALPIASVNFRGCLAFVRGNGTSTADSLYVCLIASSGSAYNWKLIVAG